MSLQQSQLELKIMTNVINIIVPIILSALFIAVSFYLYTIFCHPDDSGLGTSLIAKILVIASQFLAWAQLLLVVLDLSVQDFEAIKFIYDIVYIVLFALTAFILPFFSALYQTDDDHSRCKQICKALIQALIISGIWCAVTFISFIFLSRYTDSSRTQRQISAPFYMYLCQALLGWILLAINGALGLIFFPFELINGFFNRPKKITKQQAFELKKELQDRSDELIEQGQKLCIEEQQFQTKSAEMNFFSRRRKLGQIKDSIHKYKTSINQLEFDYERFSNHLNTASQNPLAPFIKLIGGILSSIISLIWVVQLFGSTVYVNGNPAFRFLDDIFSSLSQDGASFIASILYGVMVIYMLICLIKGNVIFGIKIPYVLSIHPLEINKTYLNSLLFNSSIMLITSLSISEMTMITFPTYLRNSYLGTFFFNEVRNLPVFGFLFRDRIYTIVLLSCVGLSLIYMAIKICRQKRKRTRRKSEGKVA